MAYATDIYFLTVLEAKTSGSRCGQVWFLVKPLLLAFRQLPSFCVLTFSYACGQRKRSLVSLTFLIKTPTSWFHFLKIEVQLLHNIVLVFSIQQSDSVLYIFMFLSIMIYYRMLNILPCALQQDLVVYPFILYIIDFIWKSQTPNPASAIPHLATTDLFCLSVCFCFINKFICAVF